MTRDEIIRMAREAGFITADADTCYESLADFAALVAAAEREACAKVCDERERPNLYGVRECAANIRARSET